MLTVKVIRPDGSEYIEEASSVFLNNPQQSPTGRNSVSYFSPVHPALVVDGEPVSKCQDVYEGTVYVMNSNGKTVGNYCLGSEPAVLPGNET